MKYIKLYDNYRDIDPYGEEDWDEVEESDFIRWIKSEYPDHQDGWINIKYINCSYNKLTSLRGIEKLTSLEMLWCSFNNLTSLEGIEELVNLKILNCSGNQLINLEGIEKLTNLDELYCSYNNLTSLRGIERLTNLKKLYCFNNNFSDEYKNYIKDFFKNKKLYFRFF